jgi:hypothetical protein
MASPRRIVRIYGELLAQVDEVADFLAAQGGRSGTVALLKARDGATLLRRYGEEMAELCGVLDGTHRDSYLMEATQTFYWASCFAAVRGASWEALEFAEQRRLAASSGISGVAELRAGVGRLVALGPEQAKPSKLFLLWLIADRIYRAQTPPDKQWSLEQLLEADLQDMKKRPYLEPILRMVPE